MGNANAKSEGEVLSSEPPDRPYNGPAVHYYFMAGQTREVLHQPICDQYIAGRRLLVLKKKPLSDVYVGIFRDFNGERRKFLQRSSDDGKLNELGCDDGQFPERRSDDTVFHKTKRDDVRIRENSSHEKLTHVCKSDQKIVRQHKSDDTLFRVETRERGKMFEYSSEDEIFYEITNKEWRKCEYRSDDKLFRDRRTEREKLYDSEEEICRGSKDNRGKFRKHQSDERFWIEKADGKFREHTWFCAAPPKRSSEEKLDNHDNDKRQTHRRSADDVQPTGRDKSGMRVSDGLQTNKKATHREKGSNEETHQDRGNADTKGHRNATIDGQSLVHTNKALQVKTANRHTWKYHVVRLWMHGQLRSVAKGGEGEGKRKIWVTDIHCLTEAIAQHVRPGQRVIGLCMMTVRTDYDESFPPESAESMLHNAVNTIRCHNETRLAFKLKKYRQAIGVELFVEEPTGTVSQPQDAYRYQIVSVSATLIHIKRKYHYLDWSVGYLGHANIVCDWSATFNQHLSQGWKLVDIFVDIRPPPPPRCSHGTMDHLSERAAGPSAQTPPLGTMTQFQFNYLYPDNPEFRRSYVTWKSIDLDILWIFEKPQSRERDTTPRYEGKIVPHATEVSSKEGSEVVLDGLILGMGAEGWELATYVERASFWPVDSSFRPKVMMNTLLFFQRRVVSTQS